MSHDSVLGPVERYYSAKVTQHGAAPAAADWNSSESQELRFRELLRICRSGDPFSINDIGCGYGALVPTLQARGHDFTYRGFDISPAMVEQAWHTLGENERWSFTAREDELAPADYSVASGIFNVKLEAQDEVARGLGLRAQPSMIVTGPNGTETLQDSPTLSQIEAAVDRVD